MRDIHVRCLRRAIQHNRQNKPMCEICQANYTLPAAFYSGENLGQRVSRQYRNITSQIMNSHIGPALRGFGHCGWYFGAMMAASQAAKRLTEVPAVLLQARQDPAALKPLVPGFLLSLLIEPWMGADPSFHIETAAFYCAGWLLDALARSVHVNFVSGLPVGLQKAADCMLLIPACIGFAIQALELSLLSVITGLGAGWCAGVAKFLATPFQVLAWAAEGGSNLLGFLAALCASSAKAVGNVAGAFIGRGGAV